MVCLLSLSDALRRVASAPENVLGGRGGLLHGGIDCHLHVPVQKCVRAVQTDNGHVRRRVSVSTATRLCWWHKTEVGQPTYWYNPNVVCHYMWIYSLRDLGLERYHTVELFARILLPAAFLLACILQLHYFNSDFLTLTDLDSVPVRQASRWGSTHVWTSVFRQSFAQPLTPTP